MGHRKADRRQPPHPKLAGNEHFIRVMEHAYPPRGPVRYKKVRQRLIEMQGYRCACCPAEIKFIAYSTDPHRASIVVVNRDEAVSYDNSVLLCLRCAGDQGNFPSLLDFYEHLQTGAPKKVKPKVEYTDTISLIRENFLRLAAEAGVEIEPDNIPENFRFAPPFAAPKIAEKIFENQLRARRAAENRARFPRPPKGMRFVLTAQRRENFAERQNHRCCYCHEQMISGYEPRYDRHPRAATWEHVVERRNGGQDESFNLVIACSVCNNLRDVLNLTAYEFYDWAQQNKEFIEMCARDTIRKRMASNKPIKFTIPLTREHSTV